MKTKFALLALLVTSALSVTAQVQIPTNAPSVDLGQEQFGLTTAAVTDGEEARSSITVDYDVTKNFYLRSEFQLGVSDTVIENLGVGLGFYKTVNAFRLFAGVGTRYSWQRSEFQGLVGAGAAYQPFENGALAKWSIYSEFRLMTPFNNDIRTEPPHREILAGIRYSF